MARWPRPALGSSCVQLRPADWTQPCRPAVRPAFWSLLVPTGHARQTASPGELRATASAQEAPAGLPPTRPPSWAPGSSSSTRLEERGPQAWLRGQPATGLGLPGPPSTVHSLEGPEPPVAFRRGGGCTCGGGGATLLAGGTPRKGPVWAGLERSDRRNRSWRGPALFSHRQPDPAQPAPQTPGPHLHGSHTRTCAHPLTLSPSVENTACVNTAGLSSRPFPARRGPCSRPLPAPSHQIMTSDQVTD